MQKRGNVGEYVAATKKRFSVLHKLRDRVVPIADTFLKLGRDERNRLGAIEAQSACKALLRKKSCLWCAK